MLDIRDLSVRFGGVVALDAVSLSVRAGEICALIGPNGAGKTTLFNCVSRFCQPGSGSIAFRGREVLGLRESELARIGIGRTLQHVALVPGMSVLDNVRLGLQPRLGGGLVTTAWRGGGIAGRRRARRAALDLLAALGLADVADAVVSTLPYGTVKRVDLARALAGEPALLLLDEPAGGLTHSEVDELGALVRRLHDDFGVTVMLVEHHMAMVMSIADHVVALEFGRVIADGPPVEVARDPRVTDAYLGA